MVDYGTGLHAHRFKRSGSVVRLRVGGLVKMWVWGQERKRKRKERVIKIVELVNNASSVRAIGQSGGRKKGCVFVSGKDKRRLDGRKS